MASAAACFELDQSGESMMKIFSHHSRNLLFAAACVLTVSPNVMQCNAMRCEVKQRCNDAQMRDMCDTSEQNAKGNTSSSN